VVSDRGEVPVIEFLASIDPASLPLLAVLAFSVSLIPVGLMLGSPCSPCCEGCDECEAGTLPDTVTVTFDGYPDDGPPYVALFVSLESCFLFGAGATATASTAEGAITAITVTDGGSGYAVPARIEPVVSADGPDGTGAVLTVNLSETTDFCGRPVWEVSSVDVVEGGSGYSDGEAIFTPAAGDVEVFPAFGTVEIGASEPTVDLEVAENRGSGATFTAEFEQTGFDPDRWEIDSVTVAGTGTGYYDGDELLITPTSGSVEAAAASLIVRNVRDEPVLTVASQGGSDLEIVLASRGTTPDSWEVDEVNVNNGGSGFSDGLLLNVSLSGDRPVEESPAILRVVTIRDEPTLLAAPITGSGTGAVVSVAVSKTGSDPDIWSADSITVTDPGTGHADGDVWEIRAVAGVEVVIGFATAVTDGNGGLVSLSITAAGEFYLDTGVIESVEIDDKGIYYDDTGVIDFIEVAAGGSYYQPNGEIVAVNVFNFFGGAGAYYREDLTAPPLVSNVTVQLTQVPPSVGTGATFTVNIDEDLDSPTFGQILSVTVDNGGENYEAFGVPALYCMGEYMNGRAFTLARRKFFGLPDGGVSSDEPFPDTAGPCVYTTFLCNPLRAAYDPVLDRLFGGAYRLDVINFTLGASGSSLQAPAVQLATSQGITDCDSFELEFEASSQATPAFDGVTATVVAGGGSIEDANDPVLVGEGAELGLTAAGVCGSCCLNEEPTPEEVTISIENLVFDQDPEGNPGPFPDGNYVLAREPNDMIAQLRFAVNRNATVWRVASPVPQEIGGGGDFFVVIEPCSSLEYQGANTGNAYGESSLPDYLSEPEPGQTCGVTCYKKCRVRIFTEFTVPLRIINAEYHPGCNCDDFPMCAPPPGGYVVKNIPSADLLGDDPWFNVTVL
jgi:hypothetical protein